MGNQDTVQTQICELEETIRHTEVRKGVDVGLGSCLDGHAPLALLPVQSPQEEDVCGWRLWLNFLGKHTSARLRL